MFTGPFQLCVGNRLWGETGSRKAKEQVAVMVQWEPMGNKSPVGATEEQKCVGPGCVGRRAGFADQIRYGW